jgi:hypothetical protein
MLGKRARPVRAGGRWKRTRACGHLADGLPVLTHGRVPGRDFELRLTHAPGVLCIEVSDTRGERRPPQPGHLPTREPEAESGRGLLIVEALADRWEVQGRVPVGKTIRAELDLPLLSNASMPAFGA